MIGRDVRIISALAAAAALAVACALLAGDARARGPAFELVQVGNFNEPVHVADAPGAEDLLFVVQQNGVIKVLEDEQKVKPAFLDIRDLVQSGGEQGLLSVAFHPSYDQNRRFHVFYTNNKGDIRIDQFRRRKQDPLRASFGSRTKIIKIAHDQADNHNGGQLQFGPDGMLYAGVGDGGPQRDPENDAQTTDNLLGKLIRIEPRADGGYDSPTDNPHADGGDPGRDEIYAIGLRNPWRFSFDAATGALTIGDVGGQDREELNYVAGPDAGLGANFGWNDYEGMLLTDFGIAPVASPHTPPIAEFDHDNNGDDFSAITGGYVVNDPGLPALTGQYLFSDYYLGELTAIDVPAGTPGTPLGLQRSLISSFGEGEDGQIYVVSRGGRVDRLEQL